MTGRITQTLNVMLTTYVFIYFHWSTEGGLAIAVPGEVSGHYAAWRKFGRLPWADLVIPSVDLSEQGFIVEKALAGAIRQYEETIRNDSNFAYV